LARQLGQTLHKSLAGGPINAGSAPRCRKGGSAPLRGWPLAEGDQRNNSALPQWPTRWPTRWRNKRLEVSSINVLGIPAENLPSGGLGTTLSAFSRDKLRLPFVVAEGGGRGRRGRKHGVPRRGSGMRSVAVRDDQKPRRDAWNTNRAALTYARGIKLRFHEGARTRERRRGKKRKKGEGKRKSARLLLARAAKRIASMASFARGAFGSAGRFIDVFCVDRRLKLDS